MEEDDTLSSLARKAQVLETLIAPLSSSTSKLSSRSRAIPCNKDFHFYNNFPEFKLPNKEISLKIQSSLEALSSSPNLFGSKKQQPLPSDLDDSYDWLVNLNDEFIEGFNSSLDEFKKLREKEEGKVHSELEEGGFQLVMNKKKKGSSMDEVRKDEGFGSSGVKMGLKDKKEVGAKSKVPFHIPTIRRPQDEFNILVNNVNKPFEHVWLERSEDGSRVVHPLEKLSVVDFIDRSAEEVEMTKPLPLESTPFKLVEGLKDLKEVAAKLQDANEFAVDLEHNQYRSFQGLTCLMQISTRTEDFIIDTLKLRVHVGPYLREVFKDPSKRKVMHGADRDIEWLQRDFGIYVCNLFDTGQASRVLNLERNSLQYLLQHFCGVSANKEYQNADWRLRPLPGEMLKYAREDTHYLLHIYDLMRKGLLSASSDENDLLFEVYERSYDICIHLYQKELLTDTSFLYIYGLQGADFDSKQLSVASELYAWRDRVARDEDESTGYILPNKALLEIARDMPVSSGKLRRLVKSKHYAVERDLNTVINLIRRGVENSSAFESIAEELKRVQLESTMEKVEAGGNSELVAGSDNRLDSKVSQKDVPDASRNVEMIGSSVYAMDITVKLEGTKDLGGNSDGPHLEKEKAQPMRMQQIECSFKSSDTIGAIEKEKMHCGNTDPLQINQKASIGSVQIFKKQTCSFGALLGNSASRRKLNSSVGGSSEQDNNMSKVNQIKSSVTLPFHSFSGGDNASQLCASKGSKQMQSENEEEHPNQPSILAPLEEVIPLENNSDGTLSPAESPTADDGLKHKQWSPRGENGSGECFDLEAEAAEEPVSLSELSSSFQQCFQSVSQDRGSSKKGRKQSQEPEVQIQVKPFDYSAARKNINFGSAEHDGEGEVDSNVSGSGDKRRGSAMGRSNGEERVKGLRRHAFPASGNRSTTYK